MSDSTTYYCHLKMQVLLFQVVYFFPSQIPFLLPPVPGWETWKIENLWILYWPLKCKQSIAMVHVSIYEFAQSGGHLFWELWDIMYEHIILCNIIHTNFKNCKKLISKGGNMIFWTLVTELRPSSSKSNALTALLKVTLQLDIKKGTI